MRFRVIAFVYLLLMLGACKGSEAGSSYVESDHFRDRVKKSDEIHDRAQKAYRSLFNAMDEATSDLSSLEPAKKACFQKAMVDVLEFRKISDNTMLLDQIADRCAKTPSDKCWTDYFDEFDKYDTEVREGAKLATEGLKACQNI